MITIFNSQASASLRRIPMWLVGSDGTTPPTTQAGNQPQIAWLARGATTVNTAATLSAVSVLAGEYYVELGLSEVSAIGVAAVYYRAAAVLPSSTYFQIANLDSGDSMRMGLFALPNVAASAAGGLPTFGTGTGQLNLSGGSVGIVPGILSGVSVEVKTGGVQVASVGKGAYSGVSVEVTTGGIQVVSIGKGTYSGVSVEVKSGGIQAASVGKGVYSGVSVEVTTGGIQVASIGAGTYSGVTVGVNNLAAGTFSGTSFSITTGGAQAIADTMLLRSIAGNADGGRTVRDALRPLRNRIAMAASTMTVYAEDDVTSAWTASITTTTDTGSITDLNPAGP